MVSILKAMTARRLFPAACFIVLYTLIARAHAGEPWPRHTIDDSSTGADGVRLLDVNGDGLNDIATAWEEGGIIRAYLHPTYPRAKDKWPGVTVGKVKSGEDAVFVDLDEDGAYDVMSSCEGGTRTMFVHWAPKEPKQYLDPKAWKTEAIPATEGRMMWMYALPMQIDEEHGVDLVVAGKGPGAEIGGLIAPANPRDLATWRYEPIHSIGWVMSMQLEDMDGDGDLDVLYDDRKGESRGIYWLERVEGKWQRHAIPDSDRENMFLATGDLDQDGRRDIICAVKGGPIVWHRRTGEGWMAHEIPLPDGVGTGKSASIADIDGDSRNDVVFSCEHATGELSGLRWLSWDEDPRGGPWQSHEIAGPSGTKYDRAVLEDVDGDGDLDVIICEERDQLGVVWYENPLGEPAGSGAAVPASGASTPRSAIDSRE